MQSVGPLNVLIHFDAGPNAVLFVPSVHVNVVVGYTIYLQQKETQSKNDVLGITDLLCVVLQ